MAESCGRRQRLAAAGHEPGGHRLPLQVWLRLRQPAKQPCPVFELNGGLAKANKVFGQGLREIVRELNEALAA